MIRKFDKHRSIRTRNISTYKISKNVRDQYLNIRINDPCYTFSDSDIDSIHNAYSIYRQNVNEKHPLIDLSPDGSFESKPLSDSIAMEL